MESRIRTFKILAMLIVGGVIGGLIVNKVVKDIYDKMAQEEIDSVRDYFFKKYRKDAWGPTVDSYESKEDEQMDLQTFEKRFKTSSPIEKKDISTIMKEKGLIPLPDESFLTPPHRFEEDEHPTDDAPEEDDDEYEDVEVVDLRKVSNIYFITEDEFLQDESLYDKISIKYYVDDNVFADERDGIIPEAENILGSYLIPELEYNDIVYIRNDRMAADFEVSKVEASFLETVLGVDMISVEDKADKEKASKPKAQRGRPKKLVTDGEV
jgi:hypothetical protein